MLVSLKLKRTEINVTGVGSAFFIESNLIMANAVIPRMQGDDYQARFFWLQACRLFENNSKVIQVGYELDTVKFFDIVHKLCA